jgi:hypothetical protein
VGRGVAGFGLDDGLELTLGAHEEDVVALERHLLEELGCLLQLPERLVEVDQIDARALGEDELAHLRVPAAGLVPEVGTGFEQFLQGRCGHESVAPQVLIIDPRHAPPTTLAGTGWQDQEGCVTRPLWPGVWCDRLPSVSGWCLPAPSMGEGSLASLGLH